MAKSKKDKNKKINYGNTSYSEQVKSIIIISIIVLAFLGGFYLLTVLLLNRDTTQNNKQTPEVQIQHEEILAGSSFDSKEEEYIVLYYDKSDEDISSDLNPLVSNYSSKDDSLTFYTVDLGDSINKNFVTKDESNSSATKASELKIKSPTLIKFKDGSIDEYIEDIDSIKDYLD